MSKEINGFITWIRTFLDDVYALKGQGGNISLDDVYPVGSIYMSASDVNPSNLFGGTWQKIEDKFLLASGSSYSATYDANGFANATGGASTVSLTESQMPRHTHIQNSHNHTQKSHSHQLPNSAIVYYSNDSGSLPNGTAKKYVTNTTPKLSTNTATAENNGATATNKYTGGSGTSESASNGSAHNNMPPYLVVNVWRRTA